jgi:membrane-associated protease RseP (regulator of RpoE activity)
MSSGNGHGPVHAEVLDPERFPRAYIPGPPPQWRPYRKGRSLALALALFAVTLLSSLATGAQFAAAYANNQTISLDDFFRFYGAIVTAPRLLLPGIPFAFTLLGILLAHELGHWFACRYHHIQASYPYFIPAPTLIGTLGAFIKIRSPIRDRRALFDVGLSGPVVGFILAIPALAIGIWYAKIIPGVQSGAPLLFGDPLLLRLLEHWLRPGIPASDFLLHPVGRAAWAGLFATALNLLPAGQLDGGHILYSVSSARHRQVTFSVALFLVPLSLYFKWYGWIAWSVLLLALGFRHPPLLDIWHPLDRKRLIWAAVALLIFLLCFMPAPIAEGPRAS